jgi:hypothetical protein
MFQKMCISEVDILFIVILSSKIIYKNTPLFLILNFQQIMNSEFKENIVFKDFEIENGVLGLDRDVYLNIVKFLDSALLREV